MTKQAVIYARVSSDRQEREGFSIPAQIKLLKEYAQSHDIKIKAEFVEAETAKKSGRKQFNEMVKFLKKNKSVRAILVEKTDRLYRNLKDYVLLDEFQDLEVHFVKEAAILSDKSRSQDKFMHGIRVLMAKNYIDNLSEEIKKGLKEKAEQGYCPTKAPFGYKNIIRKDKKRIIVPDPETAPYIKEAFELYLTGVYSYESLAKILTDKGFKPNGKPCTKRAVECILHNPFYVGVFEYMGKRYENAIHEPIIPFELFYTVQKKLHEQFIARPQVHNFLYTGLIKCKHCGCSITAQIKKGKYIYYHCTGRKGGDCKKKYIRQEAVEKAFVDFLVEIELTQEEGEGIKGVMKEMLAAKSEFTDLTAENLEKEIKRLRKRLDNLYNDKTDGVITPEFYFEKKAQWQNELDDALIKFQTSVRYDRTFMDNVECVLELCNNAHRAFLSRNGEEKIMLLKTVCSNFFFDGENIEMTAFPPFDIIIKRQNLKKLETGCQSQNLFFEKLYSAFADDANIVLFERIKNMRFAA